MSLSEESGLKAGLQLHLGILEQSLALRLLE